MKNITHKNLKKFSKVFNKKKTNRIIKNINPNIDFIKIIQKNDYKQKNPNFFNKFINVNTKPTDQKDSGRCWIFAFLNVIRISMIKKYNLDNFEFSQNYLAFYDRLEKSNYLLEYFLNNNIKKNDVCYKNRIKHILSYPTSDGGTWIMFKTLIEKYGLIPKNIMNDSYNSENTNNLNMILNSYLRKCIKKIILNEIKNKKKFKNEILSNIYKILVYFLGEPPNEFNWQYYSNKNKKKVYKIVKNLDPVTFYKKYVPYDINDKVCLINYPCKEIQFYNTFQIELTKFAVGEKEDYYINVPMKDMENSIKKSISRGEAIWIGCDFDKSNDKSKGIMDTKQFNYKEILDIDLNMDKCNSLRFNYSSPTHAVILTGYNDSGKNKGYKIENSWGENDGKEGKYFMSQEWFDNYVYLAVVDKKFAKNILKKINKKPKRLSYLEPFAEVL